MRKKLFAILMSAMMMVTFMPAMAFAAETPVWAADYSSVSYQGITYPVVRTLDGLIYAETITGAWTGLIEAKVDATKVESVPEAITPVKYYDLSNISVVEGQNNQALKSVMSATTFKSAFPQTNATTTMKVGFTVPSYVYKYAEIIEKKVTTSSTTMKDYTVTVATPSYNEDNLYAPQTFTLNWNVNLNVAPGTTVYNKTIGSLAPMTITVSPTTKAVATMTAADYYVDKKTALNAVKYDGAEHEVNQVAYPGITTSYKIWKDGAFVAVDKAVVKDAGTYTFEATATDGTNKQVSNLTVVVGSATAPTFGFEANDSTNPATYIFKVAENYNAADYLKIYTTEGITDAAKADQAAVKANEALLMEYFNDFYEIKTSAPKYDATQVTATIEPKTLNMTAEERDALVAKYAAAFKNFNITVTRESVKNAQLILKVGASTAYFTVTAGGEIDWVKAPLTKTYKYKNLKKKAKTFTVKATADSTVKYFLENGGSQIKINKTTGKVTVKKGLKKGTYKVRVWAQAGNAENYFDLKIKVR